MAEAEGGFEYDAFISYRRSERAFAERLEKALERYAPPAGLGLPERRLKVFRDESDLDGSDYHGAIEEHASRARKLIVLCSPAARASGYVDGEIDTFVRLRGKEHLVSILIDGIANNEAGEDDEARKAFPEALVRALDMPLASSYLGFDPERDKLDRGGWENSWYTVLANLLEVPRARLEERERKRRRRRRRIVAATVSGVMAALAALAVWALIERQEARRQSVISHAQQLAAQSQLVLGTEPARLERSVLLGVQAVRSLGDTGARRPEVDRALRAAATLLPPLERRLPQPAAVTALAADGGDGRVAALVGGVVTRIDLREGRGIDRWPIEAPLVRAFAMAAPWAAAADRLTLRVLDLATGRPLAATASEMTRAVALHPGARLVAAARNQADRGGAVGDDTVRVWRLEEGALEPHRVFERWPDVGALAFSPRGDLLAAATPSTLAVWRLADPAAAPAVTLPVGGGRLAFSPDGRAVAIANDNSVRLWRPFADPPGEILRIDQAGIRDLAFRPDGRALATSGSDRTARVWSLPDGRELLRMPHAAPVGAVLFAGGGERILTGSGGYQADDDAIRVWAPPGAAAQGSTRVLAGPGGPPDAAADLVAYARGELRLATGPGGRRLRAAWLAGESALRVSVDPGGETVARIDSAEPLSALGLAADGSLLAAAAGRRIRLFDLAPFAERPPLELERPVHALALGPEGRWLLAATRDGANVRFDNVAWLWDLEGGAPPRPLEHERRLLAVAIARDGSRLATGSHGAPTRVWTLAPFAVERELPLANAATALAFGAEPWMLATGAADRTARIWDVRTGRELVRFDHREGVVGVAFGPAGRSLVTAGFAGPFRDFLSERPLEPRVWPLEPDDAVADACRRLTRDLDPAERASYGTSGPLFDPTCPAAATTAP